MSEQLFAAVRRRDFATLQSLLTEVSVNVRDKSKATALMEAVLEHDPAMVQFLIDRGADVDAQRKDGWTALHFAARDGQLDIVQLLLAAGANVDPTESFGNTPLARCVTSSNIPNLPIVRALLAAGADPTKKNKYDSSALDVARLAGKLELVALLEGAVD